MNDLCEVDVQSFTEGSNHPLLVSFSNGQIKSEAFKNVKFRLLENSETVDRIARKRPRRILVAETERLNYVGYNYGPEAPRVASLCSYHLGVFNKRTKKMKFYNTQLFNLKPFFKTEAQEQNEEEEMEFKEKVSRLTSMFGSKMKKGYLERSQQTFKKEDLDIVAAKAVEEAKNITDTTPVTAADTYSNVIPPQNRNATVIKDVYQLQDIISDNEYNTLEPDANNFLNATQEDRMKWKKESKYGVYVTSHLETFPDDEELRNHKARLLAYFHFMSQLSVLRAKELKRKDPLPSVPDPFKENLFTKFTVKSVKQTGKVERSFPYSMKDKLTAHAMVLALLIDKYEINLNHIQTDFKVSLNRLVTISEALGCYISVHRDQETKLISKIAKLRIPLNVIIEKKIGNKRRIK